MHLLTSFALGRRSVTIALVLLIFVMGLSVWSQLPAELFPKLRITTVQVVTFVPGSNPSAVVSDVTEPLEAALAGMKGLERIESTSSSNRSTVLAYFADSADMDEAEANVVVAVAGVVLPESARPVVRRIDPNAIPIVQVSVVSTADRPTLEMQRVLEDLVIPPLKSVSGISRIDLTGHAEPQIIAEVDLDTLHGLGMDMSQVTRALGASNINIPAGEINESTRSYELRTSHELGSLEEVSNVLVGLQTAGEGRARPVLLRDVANVRHGTAAAHSISRTSGQPSLSLAVSREEGANIVDVSRAVLETLEQVAPTLPGDIQFIVISNDGPAVVAEVRALVGQGVQGFVLAIMVVFVFLINSRSGLLSGAVGSLRPTAVIAVTIPSSILAGVLLVGLGGFTLNMMTLAGLAIAIGRVVDDGIVVLENMYRHILSGESRAEAAFTATREVGGSVVGSTIATIAVFAPLALIPGVVGQMLVPLAAAVTFALLASTLVALTVVPVLGSILLRADGNAPSDTEVGESYLQRAYTPVIRWALRHKIVCIIGSIAFVVAGGALLPQIPIIFLPQTPPSYIQIDVELPPGTGVGRTFEEAHQIEKALNGFIDQGEVAAYKATIGAPRVTSGPGANATGFEFVNFIVSLPPEPADDLEDLIRAALPDSEDVTTTVTAVSSSSVPNTMDLTITGPQFGEVSAVARRLEAGLREIDDIAYISSNVSAGKEQVIIEPDLDGAARLGLTPQDVARQLNSYVEGQTATSLDVEGIDTEVVVRARPQDVDALDDIEVLPVSGPLGEAQLGSIAEISILEGPTVISRRDGNRSATITAEIVAQDTAAVGAEVRRLVDSTNLPTGVNVEVGGIFGTIYEAFADLFQALVIGIVLTILILAVLTGGFVNPAVMLASMPLAFIGGVLALVVTDVSLGISGMLGFLMLIGIVVTNALVLIEFVEQLRRQGYDVETALIEGARARVRPILMTACTTTIALVPLALGLGGGSGIVGKELATVVIGGLVSSTILTLVAVPVVYAIFHQTLPILAQRGIRRVTALVSTVKL